MISHAEILALRDEWGLRGDVVEKDSVLGWLLAAIAAQPELRDRWIFKGGTCLRKCFHETYRFSEDLDFTVVDGGPETAEDLLPILAEIDFWLLDRTGIELEVTPSSVRRGQNRRSKPTTTVRIGHRGPRNPPSLPKVKIDLTSDEVFVGGRDAGAGCWLVSRRAGAVIGYERTAVRASASPAGIPPT